MESMCTFYCVFLHSSWMDNKWLSFWVINWVIILVSWRTQIWAYFPNLTTVKKSIIVCAERTIVTIVTSDVFQRLCVSWCLNWESFRNAVHQVWWLYSVCYSKLVGGRDVGLFLWLTSQTSGLRSFHKIRQHSRSIDCFFRVFV